MNALFHKRDNNLPPGMVLCSVSWLMGVVMRLSVMCMGCWGPELEDGAMDPCSGNPVLKMKDMTMIKKYKKTMKYQLSNLNKKVSSMVFIKFSNWILQHESRVRKLISKYSTEHTFFENSHKKKEVALFCLSVYKVIKSQLNYRDKSWGWAGEGERAACGVDVFAACRSGRARGSETCGWH